MLRLKILLKLLALGAAVVTGREYLKFFRAELRKPEPEALPEPEPTDIEDEVHASDHSLALTAGAAVMFGAGALIHPVFRMLGFPLLFAGMLPSAVQALRSLRSEGRLNYGGLQVMQSTAETVAGFPDLTVAGWGLFTGGQRLLLATRRRTQQELPGAFESYEQTLIARISQTTERSVRPTLAIAGYGLLTRGPIGILGGLWTNALDIAWLTAPFSMLNTMRAASQLGILVKDGRSLEQLATIDTVVFGKIDLSAQIRPEAEAVIARLRARGLEVVVLTGDDATTEGRRVCFVGDGIDDALAMRRANVSVSLGDASMLALENSQIVLRGNSLESLEVLWEIGESFARDQRVVIGSALLATAINAAGFMFARFSLGTIVFVYLTGFGTSLVTATLPRLRRYQPG